MLCLIGPPQNLAYLRMFRLPISDIFTTKAYKKEKFPEPVVKECSEKTQGNCRKNTNWEQGPN